MNRRELRLAIVVGVLGALTAGFFAWDAFDRQLRQRRGAIAGLEKRISDTKREERRRRQARRRVELYESRSLPTDVEMARSLYKEWLLGTVAELGFTQAHVDTLAERRAGDNYWQLSFRVTGGGTLEQLTKFLHIFYRADQLHRIGQLVLAPTGDSQQLSIDLRSDALIIPSAENREQLKTDGSRRLAHGDLASYLEAIVQRNFFTPANQPPQLAAVEQQTAAAGQPLTLQLSATDPNAGDQLRYELQSGAPEGATIDSSSGQLQWTPSQPGRFELTVVVHDNGTPPQKAEQKVVVQVEAKSPDAEATQLTGLAEGKELMVWLSHNTSGKRFLLKVGDDFQAGSLQGKLLEIGRREAKFQVSGQELAVRYGETFSQARERSSPSAGVASGPGSSQPANAQAAPASSTGSAPAAGPSPATVPAAYSAAPAAGGPYPPASGGPIPARPSPDSSPASATAPAATPTATSPVEAESTAEATTSSVEVESPDATTTSPVEPDVDVFDE